MFDWLKKAFGDSEPERRQRRVLEPEPEFRPAKLPPRRTETSSSSGSDLYPRRSPFVVGHRYRVKRDFKALRDIFVAGEELTYDYDAHSWYDGYTGYFFKQAGTAQLRAWDISDDDDLKVWKDLFEEI